MGIRTKPARMPRGPSRERTSLTDSETEDDFHDGPDAELVELKIVLRELPEMAKMDIRLMGNRSHRQ